MECNSEKQYNFIAEVEVNGQKVDLNSFVQGFISQSVIGMLKSLRGVDVVETVNLKISREDKNPNAQ